MHRRFIISLILLATLLSTFAGPLALAKVPAPEPTAAPAAVDRLPAAGSAGFYLENGRFNFLNPAPYSATGTFTFWAWSSLNPQKGEYRFKWIDDYIDSAVAVGYSQVGIAIYTYTNRFVSCPLQGIDAAPGLCRWARMASRARRMM